MPLAYERFNQTHVAMLHAFDCGEEEFHEFIIKDSNDGKTVSYCFVDTNERKLVCYVSLACSGIMREAVLDGFVHEHPRSLLSAIEIKFFVVAADYRHLVFSETSKSDETLSVMMFNLIISKLYTISTEIVGAHAVVLYSTPQAKRFYQKCGMRDFETLMKRAHDDFTDGCIPMYMLFPVGDDEALER